MTLLPPEKDGKLWVLVHEGPAQHHGRCRTCDLNIRRGEQRKMWRRRTDRLEAYTHATPKCDL